MGGVRGVRCEGVSDEGVISEGVRGVSGEGCEW